MRITTTTIIIIVILFLSFFSLQVLQTQPRGSITLGGSVDPRHGSEETQACGPAPNALFYRPKQVGLQP
jgi:hypothetical protein